MTVVGARAAGKPEYFAAHHEQLPKLWTKPLSGPPGQVGGGSRTRNPFGVPEVPDPDGADVQEFAATVNLDGNESDANAKPFMTEPVSTTGASIEGEWASRWNMPGNAPGIVAWTSGTAIVKSVGNRVYILYKDDQRYLIDAQRVGKERLVGRYLNLDHPNSTSPWVGRIINPERIDGQYRNGRWDFRRKAASAPEHEWVQLFNGKDLTGWYHNTNWTVVENGVLSSRALSNGSSLVSTRNDFENFHLRVEARINGGGNSGVFFRCPSGKWKPDFYEVQINDDSDPIKTGSLSNRGLEHAVKDNPIRANEWFQLEIIAIGNAITVKLNDKVTAAWQDPNHTYTRGSFHLQEFGPNTVAQFKKIEIKELPPEEPGWVQLFNGKDKAGWKAHPDQPDNWRVEEGLLVGSAPVGSSPAVVSHLFSERGDYQDFHLRAEAKINFRGKKGVYFGNSGIFFRAPFNVQRMGRFPTGYEAQIFAGELDVVGGKEPNRTGSLYNLKVYKTIVPGADAGEWFVMEVIARVNRITIKVNGVTTVDDFEDSSFKRGHFALQQLGAETVVHFKKIEIKELPPTPPGSPPPAVAPFDAKQAKAK